MFVPVIDDGVPPAPLKVTNAPALPTLTPSAVTTPVPTAAHAITVVAEFSIRHGAVALPIVVVPGTIEVAAPPTEEMTPPLAVIVVLSTFTTPNTEDEPF
jgi:hypothetical protein